MTDSKDTCYACGKGPGICVAPHTSEWEDCPKNCKECDFHRCSLRNKCKKLYPTNETQVKKSKKRRK